MPSSIRNRDAVTGYRQLSNIARVSVALISAVDPYPTDAGKKVVLAGFVSYFAERYGPENVHYIKVGAASDHEFPVRLHVVPAPSRATVLRNIATKVSTGRSSLQEAFLGSPKTAAEISRIIGEIGPQLQVYDTVRMAQYAGADVRAKQVCYLDDLFSERYDRMLKAAGQFDDVEISPLGNFAEHIPAKLQPLATNRIGQNALLRIERALVRRSEDRAARTFRRCLLVNDEEAAVLTRRAGVAPGRVKCVPPLLKAPTSSRRTFAGTPDFIFLGLLSLPHNDDGIQWFLRAVWPTVLSRRPDARLRIIGRDIRPDLQALAAGLSDTVSVEGYVEDLSEALGRSAAMLNPLRFGSGVKLKVIEALGRGVPVVSTPVGAEGIGHGPGTGVLVAQEPAAIAELLCSLTDVNYNATVSADASAHFAATYAREAVFSTYDIAFGA